MVVVAVCALGGCAPENTVPESLEVAAEPPPSSKKPTRIEVEPGRVMFPRAFVGQAAVAPIRVRNTGEALSLVELAIPSPFTVSTAQLNLPPDAEHTVELRLEPSSPGLQGAVLTLKAGARKMEIVVIAQVEHAAPGAQGEQGTQEQAQVAPFKDSGKVQQGQPF